MQCPACGTENDNAVELCSNCHKHLPNKNIDQYQPQEGKNYQTETSSTHSVDWTCKKEESIVTPGVNIAIIIGTVLFPVIGVAMGYTYLRKDHPDAKRAGRNWLILGITMFVFNILLINSIK